MNEKEFGFTVGPLCFFEDEEDWATLKKIPAQENSAGQRQ